MRRVLGLALVGLFAFLLVVGLLAQFYAPGQVKKTPLDVNTITNLSGTGSYLGSAAGPVSAWQRTVNVASKSTSDVIVMQNFTCAMKDPSGNAPQSPVCLPAGDQNLISASEDTFAEDRVTAMAVNDAKYVGGAQPHQGLVNKFPFDVQKKTYPVWNGVLGKSVDATFAGEDTVDGLLTYKFQSTLQNVSADIATDTPGVYSDDLTMWIDPVTGSFINQTEHQVRALPDGTVALDLTLAFTDATVKENVDAAKSNGSQLGIIGALPLVSYVLALIALVAGVLMVRGTTSAKGDRDEAEIDRLIDLRKGV